MTSYQVTHYPRCVLWGQQHLTRPTTSFARGCKLWSRERRFYEEERQINMLEFSDRPYLRREYPEIGKHYPGTWRVVGPSELDHIVARLTQQTKASISRAEDIRERSAYVRFIVDREKAKDIMFRTHSAHPRLEGNSRNVNPDKDIRRKYSGNNRKCKETAWTHSQETSPTLPAV